MQAINNDFETSGLIARYSPFNSPGRRYEVVSMFDHRAAIVVNDGAVRHQRDPASRIDAGDNHVFTRPSFNFNPA